MRTHRTLSLPSFLFLLLLTLVGGACRPLSQGFRSPAEDRSSGPARSETGNAGLQPAKDTSANAAWTTLYRASKPLDVRLIHTRLELRPLFESAQLRGKAWIEAAVGFYPVQQVKLDAQGFEIHRLSFRTLDADSTRSLQPLYTYDRQVVTLNLPRRLEPGTRFEIHMEYTASPDSLKAGPGSAAIQGEKGLYFIRPDSIYPDKPWQVWTQGETDHNSCWFPTIDAPNQKTTQHISLTVDTSMVTLSNGLMTSSRLNADGTRTDVWEHRLPHAPYLAMIAVGRFAVVKDRWRSIPVHYYVEPRYAPQAERIFHRTKDMLTYYSQKLGVDYPWSSYHQIAVRDFVSGAMENTGAVVFGQWAQRSERELVDGSAEGTVAHEMFHHWFGDLVTCESWSNLSLNESFATYGTPLWYEHAYGPEEADAALEGNLRDYLAESKRKQVDLIRYYYENNEDMFDRHSYAKGGRILHMLRNEIGDRAFFESIRLYLTRFSYKSAEIHDFRLICEEVTGRDLQIFFNQWFLSKGHPIVDMNYRYDSLNKQCVFEFRQKHSALPGRTFRLPVQLEFYFFDSSTARTVVLDQEVQEFRFDFPRPVWTGHNLGRILLCEYNDGRTFDEFVQQFKGSPFYYDRKRALEALVQNPQRFWGAWTDPNRTTEAVTYQDLMARAFRDPSPVIRGLAADAIPASLLKKDALLYGLLVRTAEKDIRSQVRQKALLKLIETADSGKALPLGWLEQKIATDSSLLVTAAALRPIAKTNPNQAEEIAQGLQNESSMVGALFGFYADFGQETTLQYLEKSLMQLRDSRSLRQYPTWLKDYNRAILRLNQKERGLAFYEKLKLHPSARIRTLAAENLSGLR